MAPWAGDKNRFDPVTYFFARYSTIVATAKPVPPRGADGRAAEIDCMRFAHILMMAFDGFAVNYSINRAIYCDDAMIEQMCAAILGGASKEV